MQTKNILLGSLLILPLGIACDETKAEEGHFEIQAQAGISHISFSDGLVNPTSGEGDKLSQENNVDPFQPALGIGYVFPLNCNEECHALTWFPAVKLGLNGYWFTGKSHGDVLAFGGSNLSLYDYDLNVDSFRLMLDASLTVASWKRWSWFLLAGTGESWNRINYHDTPKPGVPGGGIDMDEHTDASWAWEFGTGVEYALTENLSVSLEYLYTNFGTLETGKEGTLGGVSKEFEPTEFVMYSNAAFLGVHWGF